MLQQMVFKLNKEDKAFWSTFAQQMHCKDATEFVRKLTIIMRTTPVSDFREWFYTRLAKAEAQPDAPISRIFSTIFEYAAKAGVGEVQLQPQLFNEPLVTQVGGKPFELLPEGGTGASILYRVDDELQEQERVPDYVLEALVAVIKSKANLKISEHDSPQSGAMNVEIGN
ncbi:MAG TPA: hypothetical protein VF719_06800, partial [Abditibacteriaceae bacterium]